MMELEFYGATDRVTGSCHILRVGGATVLLDCGLVQGSRSEERLNEAPFPFDPATIDAVVLSHAHIDHSGRLPLLVKRGFRGPIYTHPASRDLLEIMLADSAHLAAKDAERENRRRERKGLAPVEPLYTPEDARAALGQVHGRRYRESFQVTPGVQCTLMDAGHIMGSASVHLTLSAGGSSRELIFSGDLGQYDSPILRDPVSEGAADLVVMECTYGDRRHRDREETLGELGEILREAASKRGNVLIPAFAVGRSQEILYHMGRHFEDWELGRWQVYLDSPMAIEASKIYWEYTGLYDEEATRLSRNHQMPGLGNLTLSRDAEDSMRINDIHAGAIVIAGSGMCNGGRIVHHLKRNLWRPECHVIIAGYQAQGTLGRRLVEGREYVRIHGSTVRVAAQIHTIGGLSAHGDYEDLLRWYAGHETRPPVYLVHGEAHAQKSFAARLEKTYGVSVRRPAAGERLDLTRLPAR